MIRRHEYQAITVQPQSYDHVNWIRLLVISVACVLLLGAGIFFFLRSTTPGQRWLAASGREASGEAYHEVGRMFMAEGAISRAVTALEVAQIKEPDNLEIIVDLGRAYMGNGQYDRAELAFSYAIENWPAYPEPYRLMINNLIEQNRNYEALDLVRIASEGTGDSYFQTLYRELIPATPSANPLGGRFNKETEIELTTPEKEAEIYYTTLNEDPRVSGILYEGPFILPEGGWRVRAVAKKDGMFSEELVQNYSVIKDVPDMPRASHGPGSFAQPIRIKLFPRIEDEKANDIIAIYYTTDGTAPYDSQREMPTPNAIQFDFKDENASILLRIGKTTVRAS